MFYEVTVLEIPIIRDAKRPESGALIYLFSVFRDFLPKLNSHQSKGERAQRDLELGVRGLVV